MWWVAMNVKWVAWHNFLWQTVFVCRRSFLSCNRRFQNHLVEVSSISPSLKRIVFEDGEPDTAVWSCVVLDKRQKDMLLTQMWFCFFQQFFFWTLFGCLSIWNSRCCLFFWIHYMMILQEEKFRHRTHHSSAKSNYREIWMAFTWGGWRIRQSASSQKQALANFARSHREDCLLSKGDWRSMSSLIAAVQRTYGQEGAVSIVVATSVLAEGIDVPSCGLVLCSMAALGWIQRLGFLQGNFRE